MSGDGRVLDDLDSVDLAIVGSLQEQGRTTNAHIARLLGVSEPTVRKRIDRLVADEIIKFVAVLNPRKTGYATDVLIGIRVEPGNLLTVGEALSRREEVVYLGYTTGRHDILVEMLFRDDEGTDGYYSLDGSNRAKAFLRSPVEFSRVSSGFGARFHPIFNNWRAHTGVDFAAPKGTRVLATADGNVIAVGARGGYGNAVEIKHGSGITTLYAHLSGFARGVRAGSRVRQGEPIGYVGSTGYATGPHLHYEFKVAGMHQNPLRVALPKAEPVPARLRPQFVRVADEARGTLELVGATSSGRFE